MKGLGVRVPRRAWGFGDLCPQYVPASAYDSRMPGAVSGHVFRVERARGPVWYAKYRLPDGRQVQKKLGPAWTGRGRPASGYFTKRLAEDWLRETLEEARRGTLPGMVRTGATFADAAASICVTSSTIAAASRRPFRDTAHRSRRTCCPSSGRWPLRPSPRPRSSAGLHPSAAPFACGTSS